MASHARSSSTQYPRGGSVGRLVFGVFSPRKRILGVELSGVIAAVGKGVTRFEVGDPVFGICGMGMGCHAELRAVVAALPAKRLGQRVRGSEYTVVDTVLGIAVHDLYHAGQIQLLKRLARTGATA